VSGLRHLALLAAVLPAAAGGLEPRFDHRDTHGPVLELLLAFDTVADEGESVSEWRPALRAGWGFDATGEGNDLVVAADLALRSLDDPAGDRVLVALSARYRSYFGTEELKTFFELGVHAPIVSNLAAGPLVGLGVQYDFSRGSGVFAGGEFATAWGQARIVTFAVLAGAQLRFDVP
jgi:hypothetical protein